MDYVEKIRKLEEHIKNHPKDYQAVIAHLKMRSKAFEHERWLRMIERKKQAAKYRRLLNEKSE